MVRLSEDYIKDASEKINLVKACTSVQQVLACREAFNNVKFNDQLVETAVQEYINAIQKQLETIKRNFMKKVALCECGNIFVESVGDIKTKTNLPPSFSNLVENLTDEINMYCAIEQRNQMVKSDYHVNMNFSKLKDYLIKKDRFTTVDKDCCFNGFWYFKFISQDAISSHPVCLYSENCNEIGVFLNPLVVTRELSNNKERKRHLFLVSETRVMKVKCVNRKATCDVYQCEKSVDELKKLGFIVNNTIVLKVDYNN